MRLKSFSFNIPVSVEMTRKEQAGEEIMKLGGESHLASISMSDLVCLQPIQVCFGFPLFQRFLAHHTVSFSHVE
jgi:hypothetical protein